MLVSRIVPREFRSGRTTSPLLSVAFVSAFFAVAATTSGCGRTGELSCEYGTVELCPTVPHDASKITCSCGCSINVAGVYNASFAGAVPVCLPPDLNMHIATGQDLQNLAALTDAEFAGLVDDYCVNRLPSIIETTAEAARNQCPIEGIVSISCSCSSLGPGNTPGVAVDNPACDTFCSPPVVPCDSTNCKGVISKSTGTINAQKCACNQATACGNTTPVTCIAPPGSPDPIPFGLMGELIVPKYEIDIDHSTSTATFTASFTDDLDIPHSDTRTINLGGHAQLYGLPHADGSADMVIDFGFLGDDFSLQFVLVDLVKNVTVGITKLSISGGSGTSTIHIDPSGNGFIPTGVAVLDVEALRDGHKITVQQPNPQQIPIHVDFASRTFVIPTLAFQVATVTGQATIRGTISDAPPTAVAGPPQVLECTSPAGAVATLDGSATTDADNDVALFGWTEGAFLGLASPSVSVSPSPIATVTAPLGTTDYTLSVTDSHFQMSIDATQVTVQDTKPPRLTLSATPSCLWSPDHTMVLYRLGTDLTADVADVCDAAPSVEIVNVTSNQPATGGGSGNTSPDVVFGGKALCIRSERDGTSPNPRVYTVTVRASDQSGNSTTATTTIEVAKDQSDPKCPTVDPSRVVADGDPQCSE